MSTSLSLWYERASLKEWEGSSSIGYCFPSGGYPKGSVPKGSVYLTWVLPLDMVKGGRCFDRNAGGGRGKGD